MAVDSAHGFDATADSALEDIPSLFPNYAIAVSEEPGGVRMSFQGDVDSSLQDIGRLLLLNAKFRDNDIILRVSAPSRLYQFFEQYGLQRIVWLDEAESQS